MITPQALIRGDHRYDHLRESRSLGNLLTLLFGRPTNGAVPRSPAPMSFGERPRPHPHADVQEACVAFLEARDRLDALEPKTTDADELAAARAAVNSCKADVRRRLMHLRRINVPGWRFSVDKLGDLHVCRRRCKARLAAPALVTKWEV